MGELTRDDVVPALDPLRRVSRLLLDLLRGLPSDEWALPTVHPDRDVKDLAAHLLHGSLRRVTAIRDRYRRPLPEIGSAQDLVDFIQEDNRHFMNGMRRLSPGIIVELIATYDVLLVELFERLDPMGDGLGVVWAGEWTSRNWFDLAREYTEKWHHQQQIRDATGRGSLEERALLEPVLETFARGLPHAFRSLESPVGTRVGLRTTGGVECGWTLRRGAGGWSLWEGSDPAAETVVSIPCDTAWRVWTRSMERDRARGLVEVDGDARAADAVVSFVAVMG